VYYIYIQFRIRVHGYLSILPQASNILQSLKYANVIIIDEISMMSSTMLCAIEQRLKQAQDNMNPFANVLLLLVRDLTLLPSIWKHLKRKLNSIVNFVTFQWLYVGQMQVITFYNIYETYCRSYFFPILKYDTY
jgi:hypothetical protein